VVHETSSLNPLLFGQTIDERIDLRYVQGFLTPDECAHLISLAGDKLQRSQVIQGEHTDTVTDARTSHSYQVGKSVDSVVQGIESRVSRLVGCTVAHLEGMQVVRYRPGDYFNEHHDWFQDEYRRSINNQRAYTFFVYLNNITGAGGETDFPKLNQTFVPVMGDALFWRNCEAVDRCHIESLHQGKTPLSDTKYGLNIWVRFYPM
jgi:prolyl 4-hydroxylase